MIDWLGERDYKIYAWSESDRDQPVSYTHLVESLLLRRKAEDFSIYIIMRTR